MGCGRFHHEVICPSVRAAAIALVHQFVVEMRGFITAMGPSGSTVPRRSPFPLAEAMRDLVAAVLGDLGVLVPARVSPLECTPNSVARTVAVYWRSGRIPMAAYIAFEQRERVLWSCAMWRTACRIWLSQFFSLAALIGANARLSSSFG